MSELDYTRGRASTALDQAGQVGQALRSPQQKASARKLVLVSMGGLLAINVYRADREQGSLYRRLWGTGVLGLALSVVADFAPEIAGPFALLVFLGAFTNGGDQALQNILGAVSAAAPPGLAGPVGAKTTTPAGPIGPVGTPTTGGTR